jgi:tetratricopeptide (TPR) repeat protein
MKNLLLILFSALISVPALSFAATDKALSAVELNNQAVGELQKDLLSPAREHLIQALGKSPENSTLHLNLGLSFEKSKQMDKAQASYEQALKFGKNPQEKFAAAFDLGQLAQKAQKTDEALKYYQMALGENPDSKETKVNLELLMKQEDEKKQQNKDQKNQDQKNQDQKQSQQNQNNQNQDKKNQQNKDQDKDKNKDGQSDKDKNQDKQNQEKKYSHQPPPKPQFKSDQLSPSDVNKILGELKQQEQKIRAEYNRKDVKEKPNDKDW